jgi:predicted outer membrane repeat protein
MRSALKLIIVITALITFLFSQDVTPGVFISEYVEGSSNNKAIEIYNGTIADVDLSAYSVQGTNNGTFWGDGGDRDVSLSGILPAGEVYILATDQVIGAILSVADTLLAYESPVHHNGDDGVALLKDGIIIDAVGVDGIDPGDGWDVAGVVNATKDHTLIRKSHIFSGNTDWYSSAGTDSVNSEWIVRDQDYFNDMGSHVSTYEQYSSVINVPSDVPTIQGAIDSAPNGALIKIYPGVYFENIDYIGKNITVSSLLLVTQDTSYISQTIIDGSGIGSVVSFHSNETSDAKLRGLTIRNGGGSTGGGIQIINSSPTIQSCQIVNNSAGQGGGIFVSGGSPTIHNNKIRSNIETQGDQNAGGIFITNGGGGEITNNKIVNNSGLGLGSGIEAYVPSDLLIKNNIISGNSSSGSSGGITVWSDGSHQLDIINNVIHQNNATGIWIVAGNGGGNFNLYHNTIYNNSGNGILFENTYDILSIKNNIISANDGYGLSLSGTNFANVDFNCVYYNSTADYNLIAAGVNDISTNPNYFDAELGDFRLRNWSSCIGAGDASIQISEDIVEEVRPNPLGSSPDIGAYENPFETPQRTPITINIPDDYATIQAGLNAADSTDVVLVQPGTYFENIFWPETNGIKLMSAGDSSNTIIDGGGLSSVIYINPQSATIDTTTLLQGFKITNGGNANISSGGGLFIKNAGMNIDKCSVDNNISNEKGGGIYVEESNLNINNSNITNNQSVFQSDYYNGGGGIHIACSSVKLIGVSVNNNRAENHRAGGGIFCSEGEPPNQCESNLTIINSSISNNYAADEAGGIFVGNTTNTIFTNVDINGNTAGNAGGLYLHALSGSSRSIQFNGTINIRDNIAQNGAGVYTHGTNLVGEINIINNIAANRGGAIRAVGQDVVIRHAKIIGNSAANGGAIDIFSMYDYGVIIDSSIIGSNISTAGNTIYAADNDNTIDITNSFVVNNIATNAGIMNTSGNGNINISNSTLYNNSSQDGYKGIILESGSALNMTTTNIYNDGNSVQNNESSNISIATNNYWGDPSGPYHLSQNSSGQGDSVNLFVNVTPWLTAPNTAAPPIPAQNVLVSETGNDFINLEWEPSPLGDFASFKLYYDNDEPGYPYEYSIGLGSNTSYALAGLNLSTEYFLAVTVYDTDGNESWYSNEVTGVTRVIEAQNLDIAGDEDLFHLITHDPIITFDYFDSMGEMQTNYHVQISTDPTFQSNLIWDSGDVVSDGSSIQYTEGSLQNGVKYYLRASVASGSFWSNWTPLSFGMNTEPSIPIQVSLIGDEVTISDVLLEVSNSMDAEGDNLSYDFRLYDALQVTQLDSAMGVVQDIDATVWEVLTALEDNAQHWWTVQAHDGYEYSEMAGPASFLINFENDIPESFSTLSPNADEAIAWLQPQLVWEPAFDPDPLDTVRYVLYLDTPDPGVELFDVGTDTMFQILTDLQDNTTYFWKVIAHDLNGASSECLGGYQNFRVNTTNDLPTLFQLLAPVSGAMVTTLTPEFLWEQSSDPDDQPLSRGIPNGKRSNELIQGSNDHIMVITGYDLFLGTNPELTAVEPIFVTGTNYTPVDPLVENTMYYWTAIAHDDSGGSISSDTTSFWTNAVNSSPSGFSLITPMEDQTIGTINPTFSWEMANDDDLFDEVVYNIYMGQSIEEMEWVYTGLLPFIMDTSFTLIESIEDNTIYYWSVEARDNQGATTNNMEGFQSFNVNLGNENPSIVDLIAPDSVMVMTLTPEFYWTPALDPDPNDVVHYEIHWWGDGIEYDSVLTDTNAVVIPYELEDNSQYSWEVIAMDQTDGISHSEETTFWIDLFDEAPVGFALLNPEDNASGLSPRPSFLWEMAEDPDPLDYAVYMFQVATDSAFANMVLQTPTAATVGYEMVEDLTNDTEYWWRVIATDRDSLSTVSETFKFTVGYVSIAEDIALPTEYMLHQNYPNPFNPSTTIRYGLPEEANVSLVIYDVRGQVVQTLESKHQSAGWYDVVWNGHTTDGHTISTGIYFARLVAGDYSQVIKMLYLK